MTLVIIMTVAGCGGSQAVSNSLDAAESLMEDNPDSALLILNSIKEENLEKKSIKARYALLKSMALDKNYIDKTTFEVLQPAIDYYIEKGTPDEKLKTYYYQGRIFYNRNDPDSALHSFMRGKDLMLDCKDSLTVARTLVMQAILFQASYDFSAYTDSYLMAADIYGKKQFKWHEFECLLNVFNGFNILKLKEQADSVLNLLYKFESLDSVQTKELINLKITYTVLFGSNKDLEALLKANKDNLSYNANEILNLARAHHRLGDSGIAIRQLDYLDKIQIPYDTLKYLSIKYPILEGLGRYEEALDTYKDFSNRLETINSAKFEQKSRSMEEKHQLELQAERDARMHARTKWTLIGGISALVLLLAIMLLILNNIRTQKRLALQKAVASDAENKRLKAEKDMIAIENRNLQLDRDNKALEAENLALRVGELETQRDELNALLASRQEMPEEVRKALRIRVEMLNSYLASQITDNRDFEKAYDNWVADLTANTEEFMDSNRLAFQASHPEFIKYFEDHGLTESEINYVCLYAIGLRGKEVGSYMRMRSHVNISSAIRRKLGIDKHETNIGIYVRKLLRQM